MATLDLLLPSGADLLSLIGVSSPDIGSAPTATTATTAPATAKDDVVLCAVLDDATHVKLGKAHYNCSTRSYCMTDGSLQISEQCKCEDGMYRKGGETYTVTSSAAFAARLSASDIGCSREMATKTVFVLGNVSDDAVFDVARKQSLALARKAAGRHNTVVYVVAGDVSPGASPRASGVVASALDMSANGIALSGGHVVAPANVLLMSGKRELAWLRLVAPPHLREVAAPADPDAADALSRRSPFSTGAGAHANTDTPGAAGASVFGAHDESLQKFPDRLGGDEMAVAMLLKLVSVTKTMAAPGTVLGFANKLKEQRGANTDEVALTQLARFLSTYGGSIEDGMERLMNDGELTPEGQGVCGAPSRRPAAPPRRPAAPPTLRAARFAPGAGVLPAARPVIEAVLRHARDAMLEYMEKSHLVLAISNHDASPVWVVPRGLDLDACVGKLPSGFDAATAAVEWAAGPADRVEWANAMNAQFKAFVRGLREGTADDGLFKAYASLALQGRADALPLRALAESPAATCYGFASSSSDAPFGTVRRRLLVKSAVCTASPRHSDLLRVTDQWASINTVCTGPVYWGVATWCGGTKGDIGSPPSVLGVDGQLTQQLLAVSVTLASMVVARTRGRSVRDCGVAKLCGVLGPVVVAHGQLMRVVAFEHDEVDASFVALLPEAFVQFSLDHHNHDLEAVAGFGAPMLAVEGFLALPDDAAVPLGFSRAENEAYRAELGTRLWALPKQRASAARVADAAAAIEAVAESKTTVRSQCYTPGFTVLHTRQSSKDPFAGVAVGLSEVPGLRGERRITIDTDLTPKHADFRVVAKE